jgi:hypothetical protein
MVDHEKVGFVWSELQKWMGKSLNPFCAKQELVILVTKIFAVFLNGEKGDGSNGGKWVPRGCCGGKGGAFNNWGFAE